MTRYKVENQDGHVLVVGLRSERGDASTYLLYRYEDGDYDSPTRKDQMHGALYDLFQVNDDLVAGDEFETEFGLFSCRSFHVLDEEGTARWDADPANREDAERALFDEWYAGYAGTLDDKELPFARNVYDMLHEAWSAGRRSS